MCPMTYVQGPALSWQQSIYTLQRLLGVVLPGKGSGRIRGLGQGLPGPFLIAHRGRQTDAVLDEMLNVALWPSKVAT